MYDQNDYIVYQDGIARVIEVENNQVIIEDYISQEIKNINLSDNMMVIYIFDFLTYRRLYKSGNQKYKSPSYYQKDLFFRNY